MRWSARLGALPSTPPPRNRLNGLCCLFFLSPLISLMNNGRIKEGVFWFGWSSIQPGQRTCVCVCVYGMCGGEGPKKRKWRCAEDKERYKDRGEGKQKTCPGKNCAQLRGRNGLYCQPPRLIQAEKNYYVEFSPKNNSKGKENEAKEFSFFDSRPGSSRKDTRRTFPIL